MVAVTALVVDQGLANRRFGGQIPGGEREQRFERLLPLDGFQKILDGQRHDCFLSALGDDFVRVHREDGKNFGAIGGGKMRSGGADGDLAFASRAAVAKIVYDFRTKGFHCVPASNHVESAQLYRMRRGRRGAAWSGRSIPAIPQRSRWRSLQTGWRRRSAGSCRRGPNRPEVACRQRRYGRAWRRKWTAQDRA